MPLYHLNCISVGDASLFAANRVFEINRAEKIYSRRGAVVVFCVRIINPPLAGEFYLKITNLNFCDGQILMHETIELRPHIFAGVPGKILKFKVGTRGRASKG